MSSRSSSLSAEPEDLPSTNPRAQPGMGAVLSSWKGKDRAVADGTTKTGPFLPDEVIRVANEASISSLASQVAADGQLIKSRLLRAGHKFIVEVAKAPYDRADQKRIWEIFKENMSASYKVSSFGWTPQAKKQELFHPDSRYIILRADRHTSAEPEAVKNEETAREPDLGSDELVDELLVMERKAPVQSVEAVEIHSKDASEGSTLFTTAPPALSKVQPTFAPSILVDETLRATADDRIVPPTVLSPHHPLSALLSNPYLPPPIQRDPLNSTNIISFINDSESKSAPLDILPLAAVQPNPMVTPTSSLETFQTAMTSPVKPSPSAVAARYPFSLLSGTPPPPALPPPTAVASPTLDLSPQAERPAAKRRKVIHPAGERRRSSRLGSSPLKPDYTETEDLNPGRSILSSPFVKVSNGTSLRLQTTPAQEPRLQQNRSSALSTPSTQGPTDERLTPVSAPKSYLAVSVSSPVGTDGLPTLKRRGRPPKNAPSATTPTLCLDQPVRKKLGRPRKASVQRRLEAEAKALELAQELERVERERRRKEREKEEADMERARAGTVEGYLMWRFDTEMDEDGEEEPLVYLYELSVSQDFQRAGLGRYLVSRIEDVGRAWGCRKVMLTVLKSNVKAINFYRKMGYEIDHSSPSRFTWSDSEDDDEAEQATAGAEATMDVPPSASTSPPSPSTPPPPPPPPLPESGTDSQEVSGMLWIGGTWRKVKYDYEIMSKVILSPDPVRSPLAHSHPPPSTDLPSTPATQASRGTTSMQKMRLRRRPTVEDDSHLSLARAGRSSPVKFLAGETPVVSSSAREGLGGGENGNKKWKKKEAGR